MKSEKPLTQLQYNFLQHYLSNGFNAYQAAIKAGYSKDFATVSAPKLIHHPSIKPRIDRAIAKAENKLVDKLGITFEWKAKKLKRIIDDFIPDDPAIETNHLHVKVAIQALTELNRMQGDYAPDKKLSVTVDATKERLQEVKKQYEEF